MENFIVTGQITATSTKQDERYSTNEFQRTAYLTLDEHSTKLAIQKGLTGYTSKEDNTSFFIIKLPQNGLSVWMNGEKIASVGQIKQPNFKTVDGLPLQFSIVIGENLGKKFYRLQAVNCINHNDIEYIQETNPFE